VAVKSSGVISAEPVKEDRKSKHVVTDVDLAYATMTIDLI